MLTTSDTYKQLMNASVRPISWDVRMSFDKAYSSDVTIFTLDQSHLDSSHLLAATPEEQRELQRWDIYEYTPYTGRVTALEYTREMQFPSSVTAAMADYTFDNFNDYFTPKSGSPISDYILPKRPVKISAGFGGRNLQQFIGVTESMPEIDRKAKTVKFHAIDFLAQMYTYELSDTLAMQNVTTDQVLAAIFDQLGLEPNQYDLAAGFNTIPYVYFEQGKNAGDIFRELMQAEMGNLWLTEEGVIRFEPRVVLDQTVTRTFNNRNVAAIKIIDEDTIFNSVYVNADIRKLMSFQKIYEKTQSTGDAIVVKAGESLVFRATLDDPAMDVAEPTLGEADSTSWFTAIDPSNSTAVTTGVEITGAVLRTNNYTMFFQNNNAFDVEVNALQLWGKPARVIDKIRYNKRNQASIDKYEEKPYEINNNFIQTIDACDTLALTILDSFSEYYGKIEMTVKGDFSQQLGDTVFVEIDGYEGEYKITKITNRIQNGGLTQRVQAIRQTPRDYFVLDQSQLDGTDGLMF